MVTHIGTPDKFGRRKSLDHAGGILKGLVIRSGVVSVFLISQSNCAFVNYDSEARLLNAVTKCNGVAIRPNDPKCIKLVCRVRKPEEDSRAGVGAQRGVRMHTGWVQQQKEKPKCERHRCCWS